MLIDKQIKNKTIADKFWFKPEYDKKNRHYYSHYDGIVSELHILWGTWDLQESSPDDKESKLKF